jgi:2-polyprenyl-6-methoxyphenol hydroxylase-like FAD-dependent oxidoreductase
MTQTAGIDGTGDRIAEPRTALVVGGGIAGPAAAMAMQKAGIEPVVYEAHPTGADGVGVFLTLGSNGLEALRALGADAPSAGFPTPAIALRSWTGKRLGETRISADGTISRTLKRADLYRLLREQALARGIRFEHGKRLVAAEESTEGVRATFADGSEAAGDLLVGCDGIHSTVRRIIDPSAPAPAYAGLLSTGGYARGVAVGSEPGRYEMIFGRRAFFGYAASPDGEVWWFANVPRPAEPAAGELRREGDWRRRLLDLYAGDAGPAAALIEATDELMPMSAVHSIPHLPVWHRGRMVVLGDAAHAPSPTSGQGASLAIEDGVVLAKCLRDLPGHRVAFARYESERRPRVERIIKAAARINNSKAAGPVARMLRDAMLPAILRMTADGKAHRQTYGHRIEWEAAA